MTRILLGFSLGFAVPGSEVEITGDELHYLRKVRRHGVGDEIRVFDENGNCFDAEVVRLERDAAVVSLKMKVDDGAAPLPVHILAAVPKEKILDDVIRKLSELGVARFTPLICQRSSVVPGDQRLARWRRIASQSMRQCLRSVVLEITEPQSLQDAVRDERVLNARHRFILHPSAELSAGELFSQRAPGAVAMMIGPEGGFTEAEVALTLGHAFAPLQFGKTILRMETAMLVASVACITLNGGYDR